VSEGASAFSSIWTSSEKKKKKKNNNNMYISRYL
jgi:hypothetical protein